MAKALLAGDDVLKCIHICWENIILHSHPEIEISFKFIPKILMSKEYIHFFGPLFIAMIRWSRLHYINRSTLNPFCVLLFSDLESKHCTQFYNIIISKDFYSYFATLYYYSEISGCTLMLLILACDVWHYVNLLRRLALQEKINLMTGRVSMLLNRARRLTCFLSASVIRKDLQFGTWTDPSFQRHYQFRPTTWEVCRAKDIKTEIKL